MLIKARKKHYLLFCECINGWMATVTKKSYVLPDGRASIVCPECGFQKIVSTISFSGKTHVVRTKCKCGCQFNVFFEFRKYFRKPVKLTGECNFNHCSGVVVKLSDLSLGGVCFEVLIDCDISAGNKGIIRFTLDDRHNSLIIKKFIVKSVSSTKIRCEFFKDKEYERELGFYLRT